MASTRSRAARSRLLDPAGATPWDAFPGLYSKLSILLFPRVLLVRSKVCGGPLDDLTSPFGSLCPLSAQMGDGLRVSCRNSLEECALRIVRGQACYSLHGRHMLSRLQGCWHTMRPYAASSILDAVTMCWEHSDGRRITGTDGLKKQRAVRSAGWWCTKLEHGRFAVQPAPTSGTRLSTRNNLTPKKADKMRKKATRRCKTRMHAWLRQQQALQLQHTRRPPASRAGRPAAPQDGAVRSRGGLPSPASVPLAAVPPLPLPCTALATPCLRRRHPDLPAWPPCNRV